MRASSLTPYANRFVTYIVLIRVYLQNETLLWDDPYRWEGSLLSFTHLERLLIQTSRSIVPEETPKEALQLEDEELKLELKLAHRRQREDDVIRRWLVATPPALCGILIWTKAFAGRINGERMAVRTLKDDSDNYWGYDQWKILHDHPIKGEEVCGGDFI